MNVVLIYGIDGEGMALFVADGLTRTGHRCSLEFDAQVIEGINMRLGPPGSPSWDETEQLYDRANSLVDIYLDARSDLLDFQP